MAVEFNKFGQYNFNIKVGQEAAKKAKEPVAEEDVKVDSKAPAFKGLEDETDLLTKNTQNLYGIQLTKFSKEDKTIAQDTNEILAALGYGNYKVSEEQVASVANSVNKIVIPGMKLAEDGAVAAHIQDPNGPFADLFSSEI